MINKQSNMVHGIVRRALHFLQSVFHSVWILAFYFLFAVMLQVFFHVTAVAATCITGCLLALFCMGLYLDDRRAGFLVERKHLLFLQMCVLFLYDVIVSFLLMVLFSWFYSIAPEQSMAQRSAVFGSMSIFVYVLYACIMSPVTEECIFRFFLYSRVKRISGKYAALVLSSLAFAAVHGTVAHMIFAFLFGCMLVFVYEYTGSHVITILCHMVYNVMSLFIRIPYFMIYNHKIMFILFVFVVLLIFVPYCCFDSILDKKSDL